MSEENLERKPEKTMIVLEAGLGETDYIIVDENDEEKSIGDLILDIAEEKQANGNNLDATKLRGMLETNRMYFKNREINPNLKVKDLNFDVTIYNDEGVNSASITLQEQHTGGK